MESTALSPIQPNGLQLPVTDLRSLLARLSKWLWVTPTEFLLMTHALQMAEWALRVQARRWPVIRRGW